MSKEIKLTSRDQLDIDGELLTTLRTMIESGGCKVEIKRIVKKRSLSQNKAIFVYYKLIAGKLNDAGFTMRSFFATLKEGFEIAVSPGNVRSVAENVSMDMFEQPVKDLSTVQIQELHRTIDKGFDLSMGVKNEFPSKEPPLI